MFSSKSLRNAILIAMVAMLAASSLWAAESARPRAGMLGAIPAKSLFCVRINNFEGTLDAANAFLKDVAPASFDAKSALFSKLGSVLGDNELKGINKKDNIAIFGLDVPSETSPGPMNNIFIGALLSVTEYEDFISGNPNCSEPDEQGISTITVNGQSRGLATNFRRFALLCPPNARDNLLKVKEILGQRRESLGRNLNPDERKQAASSPVWVYLNVKQGSQMIQPMVFAGLEKMKAQLEKAKESGEAPMIIDPAGIVNFYGGIFKLVLGGTDYVTLGLAPTSETCSITVGVKAVPETEMAEIVGSPVEGDFGNILGYLDDGAMFNIGAKVDRPSLEASYMKLFELLGQMTAGGIPEADLEELKTLTKQGINTLGDKVAISVGVNGKDSAPFWGKYVIEVKDEKTFKDVLEKELRMMQDDAISKLYKGLGMEMDVKIERGAGSYEGITIDAAKVNFKITEKSLQSQMLEKMFGDGLDYCWAFVNGNCVYTIGEDSQKIIRELIDQVKAGGPKKIGAEMKAAMDSIAGNEQADAVGTFNYVRMLNMATLFIAGGAEMPNQVSTQGGIAFAARATEDGKMKLQMVMPKKHLQEIQSAFKTLVPLMEKQHKQMMENESKEEGFVKLFPIDGVPEGWLVRTWSDVSKPAEPSVKWTVKDGILHGSARGTWLISKDQYSDFILKFDFKLDPLGNSGCALRAPLFGDPAFDGMELQMADYRYNTSAKDSELTGGIYRAIAPLKQVYKPTEWNSYVVSLKGSHLHVTLNGTVIHDLDLNEQNQVVLRHNGQPAPPVKDRPRKGHIGFQELSRGAEHVQIRNARIKVLDKQ